MATINLGVFSESLNNKADIDLRNVDVSKTDIVIEYQEPTEENGYTWYRLYATGWVEQGGINNTNATDIAITLPIKMQNNNYSSFITPISANYGEYMGNCIKAQTNTTIELHKYIAAWVMSWQVSGKVDPTVMLNHEILPSKAKSEEFEHRVIDFQKPTAENNYTWYRKYADGWVEQGGVEIASGSTITLPIAMLNTKYTVQTTPTWGTADSSGTRGMASFVKTTTSFKAQQDNNSGVFDWQVSGMAA